MAKLGYALLTVFIVFTLLVNDSCADMTEVVGARRADIDEIRASAARRTGRAMTLRRGNSTFHRQGARVFSRSVVVRIRGVVSQGNEINFSGDPNAKVFIQQLDTKFEYPGFLTVSTKFGDFKYPISFDQLLPLALLADSGGTSLYSVLGDIRDGTAGGSNVFSWAKDAGMVVKSQDDSAIVVELNDTPFSLALRFVDLCNLCTSDNLPAIAEKINQTNGAVKPSRTGDESWIITDVSIPYTARTKNNTLQIVGNLTRNSWTIGPDAEIAFVHSVAEVSGKEASRFIKKMGTYLSYCHEQPEASLCKNGQKDLEHALLREARLLELNPSILRMENGLFDVDSLAQKSRQNIELALFAFETLALFRHAKRTYPTKWHSFLSSLSTDEQIAINLSVWKRYTSSLKLVYPE